MEMETEVDVSTGSALRRSPWEGAPSVPDRGWVLEGGARPPLR
jgi:hypothetical protein